MSLYRANGKFLLTGEYLVLKGALALALPLKLGQSMSVETRHGTSLQWNAYKPDGPWFSVTLNPENLEIIDSDDQPKAAKLRQILQAVKQLNSKAFEGNHLIFNTHLDFDPNWGLGSSSTLIANLSRWANVNPYELLKMTFGGSGYDIACATVERPIYYQVKTKVPEPVEGPTPTVEPINFTPEAVSEISRAVPKCQSLDEFAMLMQCHERIISRCIGQEPVQKHFPDFEGVLKSLGAWGGDFILAATKWDENQVKAYFKEKGLEVVFGYKELVLNQ